MDDPAHVQRIKEITETIRNRPPHSLVRVEKLKSHTPYKNLSRYGSTSATSTYTHLSLDSLHHILGTVSFPSSPLSATLTVEANVTMHQLCSYLLLFGYLPSLPVEGEDFTIAGLINGFGIQSASHRVGLFHDTVVAMEIVTAEGNVIIATPSNEHKDIFFALPGSFGTLGILVTATITLRKATGRVCTRVTRYESGSEFVKGIGRALRGMEKDREEKSSQEEIYDPYETFPHSATFIEGYVFSPTVYVVAETEFIEDYGDGNKNHVIEGNAKNKDNDGGKIHLMSTGSSTNSFSATISPSNVSSARSPFPLSSSLQRILDPRNSDTSTYPAYDPAAQKGSLYYFQYLRESVRNRSVHYFTQSTLGYVFRHTRGLWWGLENYIGIPWLTDTSTGRAWLDDVMAKGKVNEKDTEGTIAQKEKSNGWQEKPGIDFTHADYARCLVTQGFYTSEDRLRMMIEAVDKKLGMYPVWICPLRIWTVEEMEQRYGDGEGEAIKNTSEVSGTQIGASNEETDTNTEENGKVSITDTLIATRSLPSFHPLPRSRSTHGRLWNKITGSPYFAFDVGVYGVPRTKDYRCFSTVRELQSLANSPTQWGLSYVTKDELLGTTESILDISLYRKVRERYSADTAFPLLWNKIKLYRKDTDTDAGVIRCWRWRRDGILTKHSGWYMIGFVGIIVGWLLYGWG